MTNQAELNQINKTPTFCNNLNISEINEVFNNPSFNKNSDCISKNLHLNNVKYIPNFSDGNNLSPRALGNQLINNFPSFQPSNSINQEKKLDQENLIQSRNKALKEKFFELKGKNTL